MRLREREWLDENERPTAVGTKARDAIEDATDRLAVPLVATLGARAVELVEAMRPLAERIMAAGEVPKLNNMGLPWPVSGTNDGATGRRRRNSPSAHR
jgi:hypothetical protein